MAPGPPLGLAAHVARYGPLPAQPGQQGQAQLIAAVERSGLAGRGGAAFPAARKMRAVAARRPAGAGGGAAARR